ncbi:MAG: alpha-galactosidase, partial [Oscillospiraceae bacterium]
IGPILQDYDKSIRTKFTEAEQITMMTLWSIFRSPLIIGGEMTGFDDFTMSLLTNSDIIEMHHNSRHSRPVYRRIENGNEYILWTSVSAEGGYYAAIFNAGDNDGETEVDLEAAEIYGDVCGKELWSGESVSGNGSIKVSLENHGAKAFYFRQA